MGNSSLKRIALIGAVAFCISLDAQADAIIPYMVVPFGQVFLLPLVVLIEAIILRRLICGSMLSWLGQSLVANIVSTLIGAALYMGTMPIVGEALFQWWFKDGFAYQTVRSACISLGFAVVLWFISWVSETVVIARFRKTQFRNIAWPCAWANLATYILLLGLSLCLHW